MESQQLNTKAMMQYDAGKKNVILAYVLLIFLGFLGLHRLYLGMNSGWLMLGLFIGGWVLAVVFIGILFFVALFIWCLIDLFLLYGYVEDYNSKLIDKING